MTKLKICQTCAQWPECPKPIAPDEFCQVPGWQDPDEPDAKLWDALQESMAKKDLNGLVRVLNHRYLVGEGR